jgi:tight adherence protein C
MTLVQTLVDPDNLFTAFVAVAGFATVMTLAAPYMGNRSLEGRMKSVANRREELRRRSREALAKSQGGGGGLRTVDESVYKRIVDRLQLSRLLEDPTLVDKLAQAGFRGPKPISRFYFFRLAAPLTLALLIGGYIYGFNDFHLKGTAKFGTIILGLVAGYYAPNMYITNVAQKRRDSIVQAFPDSLDLLLICVESGMSIEAALQKVGQEVGGSSIELAEELTLLVAELSYLPERAMAYQGLAKRVNHPGVKSVVTAMVQSERYGTPLGNALRVMSKENRELRLAAAEKKAAALPAKLTVPMIMFFLPVLFCFILGPAILRVKDSLAHNG